MIATAVKSTSETLDAQRRPRKVRMGVVTSVGREKTIRVECHFSTRHWKYGKLLKRRTRLQVHDPGNVAKLGDRVEIMECRPISKTKNWRLRKVLTA